MTEAVDQPAVRYVSRFWWWLAQVVVIAEVVLANRRFTFFFDDFVFLDQGRYVGIRHGTLTERLTPGPRYLREGLFEHFSPVTRFGFWLLGRTEHALLAGWLLVTLCVALLVLSIGFLAWSILGRSIEALLIAAIAGQGLVVVHLSEWTTASTNIMPAVAACAAALGAAVLLLRAGRSRWWGVASAALFLVGLLDYELALLFPVITGLWFLTCVGPDLGLRGTLLRLRQTLWYWLTLAVLDIAAYANFRFHYQENSIARAGLRDVVATVWHSFWEGLFPAVLGAFDPHHGPTALDIVAVVVWVTILVVAVLRIGSRVLFPAFLGFAGWGMCLVLLAWGRAAVNGTYVGTDLYYSVFPLVPLVAAVSEGLRLARRTPRSAWRGPIGRVRPTVLVLAVVAVVSAVSTQLQSGAVTNENGLPQAARSATHSFLNEVNAAGARPHIIATPTETLAPKDFYPYNYASRNLGLLTSKVSWDDDSTGRLYRVDTQGHLVAVSIQPVAAANLAKTVVVKATRSGTGCYRMARPKATLTIPFDAPVTDPYVVIGIDGTIDRDTTAKPAVVVDPHTSMPATGSVTSWRKGALHAVLYPSVTSVRSVQITGLKAGTTLCLSKVTVGGLRDDS